MINSIKTIETIGLKDDTQKNAIVSVKGNSITITPNVGFEITSAQFYTTDPDDYNVPENEEDFKIDNGIATITVDDVQDFTANTTLHVSYETKASAFTIKPLDHTTITYNGANECIVTADRGYHINSLHTKYFVGGETVTDSIIPVISSDKKTATITNPNGLGRLILSGDIAKDFTPPKPSTGTDIIRLYEVDDDALKEITTKFYGYYQGGTNTNYNFQSFINQLYKLPFAIPNSYLTTTDQIITGFVNVNAQAYQINKQEYSLNIGSITVPTTNGFDYNIKDVSIILPWLPTVNISSSDILGKTINIVYNLSMLDGSTTVVIKSNDNVINSFKTNIAQNLELFNIYNDKTSGDLKSTLQNDIRQAYIKVNYFKPIDNLISYPTDEHGILKEYNGYTKVKSAILSKSINSYADIQIQQLLKQGVIIK